MKWAVVEKFKDFLWGAKMTVVTDNNPLAHLQTAKFGAVERWVAQHASFDYTIKYRPGKDHTNANVLSRFPVDSTDPTAANQECGDDMLVRTRHGRRPIRQLGMGFRKLETGTRIGLDPVPSSWIPGTRCIT